MYGYKRWWMRTKKNGKKGRERGRKDGRTERVSARKQTKGGRTPQRHPSNSFGVKRGNSSTGSTAESPGVVHMEGERGEREEGL